MEIKCPSCSSRFNLPDSLAKPGAKLRCSVCSNVFQLPGQAAAENPQAQKSRAGKKDSLPQMAPPKSGKSKFIWLALILCLLGAGGGDGRGKRHVAPAETEYMPGETELLKQTLHMGFHLLKSGI